MLPYLDFGTPKCKFSFMLWVVTTARAEEQTVAEQITTVDLFPGVTCINQRQLFSDSPHTCTSCSLNASFQSQPHDTPYGQKWSIDIVRMCT